MSVYSLIAASLAYIATLLSEGPSPQSHQMVALSNLVIASLGSSYASGPGIDPQVNTAAARSGNNYAHLLAAKLPGSNLTDLSVSGATLLNLYNTSQTSSGTTFPPQMDGIPSDADLILVLGGGNDVNYIGALVGNTNITQSFETVTSRFNLLLDTIHTKASNAHIIGVTYLTVLGADTVPAGEDGANVVFNASRVAYFKDVAEKLREATFSAYEGRDYAEVLDVVDPSWTHGVGSSDPWMNGPSSPAYHPLAEGHVAIADMLYTRLQSEASKTVRRRARRLKARL